MEKISAVTLRETNIQKSVRFYQDVLGLELTYGGEGAYFSSLRIKDETSAFRNLEQGSPAAQWGRLIFHVSDVDTFWRYLRANGFLRERPQDASWGERYFHMSDPDGHELSFARPI